MMKKVANGDIGKGGSKIWCFCGYVIDSNLVIFCYKEIEKFALGKSIRQLEVMVPIHSKCKYRENRVENLQN